MKARPMFGPGAASATIVALSLLCPTLFAFESGPRIRVEATLDSDGTFGMELLIPIAAEISILPFAEGEAVAAHVVYPKAISVSGSEGSLTARSTAMLHLPELDTSKHWRKVIVAVTYLQDGQAMTDAFERYFACGNESRCESVSLEAFLVGTGAAVYGVDADGRETIEFVNALTLLSEESE